MWKRPRSELWTHRDFHKSQPLPVYNTLCINSNIRFFCQAASRGHDQQVVSLSQARDSCWGRCIAGKAYSSTLDWDLHKVIPARVALSNGVPCEQLVCQAGNICAKGRWHLTCWLYTSICTRDRWLMAHSNLWCLQSLYTHFFFLTTPWLRTFRP